MRKRKERTLKELYEVTERLSEVEMTPVLKGSCRIQGPMDESDHEQQASAEIVSHEKRYTHCSEKDNLHMKSESGTCNVCAAPCSSCMHYNQAVPAMESKVEDCFSEDICRGKETNQCISSNAPIYKSRKCDDQQHTASEASNLFSASSGHDSVSENAESKAPMKAFDTCDASEDVVMPPNLSGETVKKDQLSDFTSPRNQGASVVGKASSSNVYEDQRGLECHGDNISCVSGIRIRDMTAASSSGMEDLDSKKLSLGVFSKESSKKKGSSLSSVTAGFSHQSDITQSPTMKDVRTVGQESVAPGSSSIPGKAQDNNTICMKSDSSLENQVDMVNEKPPDKVMDYVNENGQPEKANSLSDSDLHKSKEMDCESEHSDSENLEQDVKVCDICGDAGREDLLAFCSRCTDGAEHTYCMKIMLDKVPEGDWVCEGCMLKEESENQKLDKFESASGTSKESSIEKNQNFGENSNSGIPSKFINRPIDAEMMPSTKGHQGFKIPCEMPADSSELPSVSKKRAPEIGIVSQGVSSTSKKPSLSRDSSFKNLDTGKVKAMNLAQLPGSRVANNPQAVPQSPIFSLNSSRMRPQSSRGFLSKSTSFNMKPKVKQFVEDISQKPKLAGAPSSGNMKKEAAFRNKSMSFKNISSTRSSFNESRSVGSPRVEEPRSLKERNSLERKNSFASERPTVSSTVGTGVPFPKAEPKVTSSSETGSATDFQSKAMQLDGKLISPRPGSSLSNKGSEVQHCSAGSSDMKRQAIYSGRSSGIPSSNGACNTPEQKPSILGVPGKPSGNLDLIQQRDLPNPRESLNWDEKSREPSSISGSRPTILAGSRRCSRCNETGHTTQFCPIDKFRDSALKVFAERNLKEVPQKSNKWKGSVETAISRPKKRPYNKLVEQSDDISLSNTDLSNEVVSEDQFSHPSSCKRSVPSLEGTSDVLDTLKGSTADSTKTSSDIDIKQEIIPPMENVCGRRTRKLKFTPSISDEVITKNSPGKLAIPFCLLCRGCFEVQRSGGHPELCDGIQAHLSSGASPKVPDVVMKFPCKIQMEEIPRTRSWPLQFLESGATEDNIALYFFARDLESYEGYYKKLLENLLKNDFALKGEISGIELLIFPSNKLPEKSQRWNRLFFLWGVFIERRSDYSAYTYGTLSSTMHTSCTVLKILPLKNVHGVLESGGDAAEGQSHFIDDLANGTTEGPLSSLDGGTVLSGPSKMFPPNHFPVQEARARDGGDASSDGERLKNKLLLVESRTAENVNKTDLVEKEQNKREHEWRSHTSGDASNDSGGTRSWLDKAADDLPVDEHKNFQMRTDAEAYSTRTAGEQNFTKISSSRPLVDLNSPAEEPESYGLYDQAIMPETSRSTESYFFPDLDPSRDFIPVHVISSDDEDPPGPSAPNLELALGGKNKLPSQDVVLPFITPSREKVGKRKERDDGASASLSLSLGFPDLGKEQTHNSSVTRQEKPLPDTSLLLFRG
ncbi:hypothetical protein QJS04_geneDACA012121 [Acorus gramineus]|uniref:Zinc finger PHD-type domain-containing protein n=1 Tax=Acorus gramineus TaxID=55184 RepID=A0AAV9BBY4_ACOGR|nr:hypothetical protein QJS04_geneDACA012121 [Acorus gramineus]